MDTDKVQMGDLASRIVSNKDGHIVQMWTTSFENKEDAATFIDAMRFMSTHIDLVFGIIHEVISDEMPAEGEAIN